MNSLFPLECLVVDSMRCIVLDLLYFILSRFSEVCGKTAVMSVASEWCWCNEWRIPFFAQKVFPFKVYFGGLQWMSHSVWHSGWRVEAWVYQRLCVCVGMDCNAADSFRTKKRRRKTLKVLNFFAGFKLFIPSVVVWVCLLVVRRLAVAFHWIYGLKLVVAF